MACGQQQAQAPCGGGVLPFPGTAGLRLCQSCTSAMLCFAGVDVWEPWVGREPQKPLCGPLYTSRAQKGFSAVFPGSRHDAAFPMGAGSVGTKSKGHRSQPWVGVCQILAVGGGLPSRKCVGPQAAAVGRGQHDARHRAGVPTGLGQQVCGENTVGRLRVERHSTSVQQVSFQGGRRRGGLRGPAAALPTSQSLGPMVGLGARPGEVGFSPPATRKGAGSSPTPGWTR